jgi:PAS domain S-box-containing protein
MGAMTSENTHLSDSSLWHFAELVPANIFVYNLKTGVTEYNSQTILKLIGYSNQDIIDMGDDLTARVVHPSDVPIVQKAIMGAGDLKDGDIADPSEYRALSKDGSWVWLSASFRVLDRDEDGNVRRVIGASHIISLQKDAEKALLEANLMLTTGVNTSPISILGFDKAGKIVSVHEAPSAKHQDCRVGCKTAVRLAAQSDLCTPEPDTFACRSITYCTRSGWRGLCRPSVQFDRQGRRDKIC